MATLFLFCMVIGFLAIGVPIAISLGMASITFLMIYSDASMASIAQTYFNAMDEHYTLTAIPFFILASAFMSTGGVAQRIIRFAISLVGHFKGGLAIASVFACMLFAALSGSSPATVIAIGTIVIAGMVQVGYTKDFAAGVICNAGTLGILIPPSIVMVVYASSVDVSVGRMFLAGVIPGLLAGFMLMVGIYVVARVKDLPSQPFAGFAEIFAAARDAMWGLFLIFIILGGIYGGVFTPTEAAAVSVVYAFFVAQFVYRDMGPLKEVKLVEGEDRSGRNGYFAVIYALTLFGFIKVLDKFYEESITNFDTLWTAVIAAIAGLIYLVIREGAAAPLALVKGVPVMGRALWQTGSRLPLSFFHEDTRRVLFEAGKLTVTLLFIIANALVLKHVLTEEQIPQAIANSIIGMGFGPILFLVMVNIILLIGGQFMEPSGLLVIVAPLVFPIAMELGIDPIHLGIIMVVNMEIGMITPPVGLNLFVTAGVAGMSMMQVVKAALPWVSILFVFLIMVTYIPIISTFLPTLLMGPEIITR
ncbi:TRAP transporter large permease [Ahrensia sp. R2A130]|uniref:TRAP transporter large permease n=1 Tax=Ahrensia sp. R2A130 TaxID=744979 RepID=UPI0001E083D9|nr:TRAP transporter large permease [Ahrensia sp. R2A130]EFL89516.1 2,3-diketo-l-gulonate trap transporter large permease protein yian [Ahrensia sp. R2A130]